MYKNIICLFALILTYSIFGQNYIKHTVQKGETIQVISQKYKVTPYDIYRLNPDSQNELKTATILLIPQAIIGQKTSTETKKPIASTPMVFNNFKTHKVLEKETIYGITKIYGITLEDLYKANPNLVKEGLKIGQSLVIPIVSLPKKDTMESISKKNDKSNLKIETSPKKIIHEVVAKETKYSIAKKYGITVEQLEKQNPEITKGLTVGYKLVINSKIIPEKAEILDENNLEIPLKNKESKTNIINEYVSYQVKSQETLYSLCKKFGIKQEDLLKANPDLINGLQEGMTLKVPSSTIINSESKKTAFDLSKSIKQTEKKQLVLLLPFNYSKIQGDTINSIQQRLKKDAFLNMTLDFYSGALMAIDSAKTLGLNLEIKIYDSQETKTTSNIAGLVKQNNLENSNAIIGPFYQIHSDKLASMLESKNVPVISPLSKEIGKSYKNSYSTMPTNDRIREAIFDYMNEKKGNIVAIVDPKKGAIKHYLTDNQKEVKLVSLNDKGGFSSENLIATLIKDKINFVVLASENRGMVLSVVNTLSKLLIDYQIRLVVLEPNDALDFEEIPLSKLTDLKLTYPSITRNNSSENAKIFEKEYKKKNKMAPNQFATRGFDLTFDTLLRLAQDKNFEATIENSASEQVENRFDYLKRVSGGYINQGVYILQYNSDLTLTEAP